METMILVEVNLQTVKMNTNKKNQLELKKLLVKNLNKEIEKLKKGMKEKELIEEHKSSKKKKTNKKNDDKSQEVETTESSYQEDILNQNQIIDQEESNVDIDENQSVFLYELFIYISCNKILLSNK